MSASRLAPDDAALTVVGLLQRGGRSVGTAESLTGGLVAAALTSVPGASAVFRGAVVAYAADLKSALLGVPEDLIRRVGTVHEDVALAMARGVRERLGASVGIGTTGVAGPSAAEGQPVGTVHIAVSTPWRDRHEALALAGSRGQIRSGTVDRALALLINTLEEELR